MSCQVQASPQVADRALHEAGTGAQRLLGPGQRQRQQEDTDSAASWVRPLQCLAPGLMGGQLGQAYLMQPAPAPAVACASGCEFAAQSAPEHPPDLTACAWPSERFSLCLAS